MKRRTMVSFWYFCQNANGTTKTMAITALFAGVVGIIAAFLKKDQLMMFMSCVLIGIAFSTAFPKLSDEDRVSLQKERRRK